MEVYFHFLPFLLIYLRLSSPELDPILDSNSQLRKLDSILDNLFEQSQSQSHVTTDDQPASLSWNKAPIWGLRPDFHYCQTIAGLLKWGLVRTTFFVAL
jgi:hypothetical protein